MSIFASLLCGCEMTPGRYKVLSFFFDGVPKPEGKKVGKTGETEKREIASITSYEHGPYAAKQCEGCHQRATNALVLPLEELCFKCHEFQMNKRWVHGPLASGGCRVCHDPHRSKYRYLLVSESESFCFYCHDEKAIRGSGAHKDIKEEKCTSCHDAHMSDKKYLLK